MQLYLLRNNVRVSEIALVPCPVCSAGGGGHDGVDCRDNVVPSVGGMARWFKCEVLVVEI